MMITLCRSQLSLAMFALALSFSACEDMIQARPPLTLEVTATAAAPTLDVPITPTPVQPDAPTPTEESSEYVLIVWMTEELAPTSDTPGGQEFLEQLAAFDEMQPDIRVEIHTKRASGAGGIISYLRTAMPVAPSILPDLALVDQAGLAQARHDQLVVPMETLLDPALLSALYPVVEDIGTVDDMLVGLPYLLEIDHSVYRETVFTAPPNSFDAVLRGQQPFVFPAGTLSGVSNTILLQYIAAGGTWIDDNGAPKLDAAKLTQVLNFYDQAHKKGLVNTTLFQLADAVESWGMYRDRQTNLAVVSSTAYLAERELVRNTQLTWIPTPDGQPYALATGWSWVVVTQEPERQAAAMALLNFLMNPVNQGRYSQAAYGLPSQHAALVVWGEDDPYVAAADVLLNNAQPMPDAVLQSTVSAAIQDALEAVLLKDVLPVQAAAQAEQAVGETAGQSP
jgi:ABC-type glycerol-3-phosphate transport system substrate-binding protein